MRILVIRPPGWQVPGAAKTAADLPIGCLYVAGMVEAAGHNVSIFDCQLYVDEYPHWRWGDRDMFGSPWVEIEKEIRKFSPDLVGITNQFTTQLDSVFKVAEIAKSVNKNIVTVVGGNHASVSPVTFFEVTGSIDVVCMGEGERRLLDIIKCLQENIGLENTRGIAFNKEGKVIINEQCAYLTNQELDALPYPAYHLVDMERYFRLQKQGFRVRNQYEYLGSHRVVPMITSRGCPFSCTFCSIHLHMGKNFRAHSTSNILGHIELLVNRYMVRHIHFEDDNLTLDSSRFNQLLDGLLDKRFGITWDTPNGVRADLLSKELIGKSKKAGCTNFVVGVESGSQGTLNKIIKKRLDLKKVEETAQACKELDLDLAAFFIIGFPQETIEDMRHTLDYALRLEKEYDVCPILETLKPLIGTEVYQEALKKGFLIKEVAPASIAACDTEGGLIETDKFTRADIIRLKKYFYLKHKILVIRKVLLFILKYPKALGCLFNKFKCSTDWKRFLNNVLFYTKCSLRNFEKHNKEGVGVVHFLNSEWEDDHRRPHITALSKYCKVVCIEPPLTIFSPIVKPKIFLQWLLNKKNSNVQERNVYLHRPFMPVPYCIAYRYSFFEFLNNRFLRLSLIRIKKMLKDYKKIIFITCPQESCTLNTLNEDVICFDCYDAYSKYPGISKKNKDLLNNAEMKILKKSDIVFTTAKTLYREKIQVNPNTYYVPNSADVELFAGATKLKTGIPEDYKAISGPRIGLIGNINELVDIGLLNYLADKHPEWSLVLVGAINGSRIFKKSKNFERLKKYPNVHLIGRKKYEELPGYQKGLDVCLLPYYINEYTDCIHPNKLYQYLAQKKPVVSTNLKELSDFRNVIKVAQTNKEFEQYIVEILKGKSTNACGGELLNDAWANSTDSAARKKMEIIKNHLRIL